LEPLAALDTPLDEDDEVMKLAERALLPPRLDLFQCRIIPRIAMLEFLVVRDEEEGFRGEVDNMALAAKSVCFGFVVNVKPT